MFVDALLVAGQRVQQPALLCGILGLTRCKVVCACVNACSLTHHTSHVFLVHEFSFAVNVGPILQYVDNRTALEFLFSWIIAYSVFEHAGAQAEIESSKRCLHGGPFQQGTTSGNVAQAVLFFICCRRMGIDTQLHVKSRNADTARVELLQRKLVLLEHSGKLVQLQPYPPASIQ